MTESKRQQKFSRLIQQELGEIFQKDIKSSFGKTFITVTRVSMSPDLGVAKAYLSFMLTDDIQATYEFINGKKKEIRKMLGMRIGKQVRIIPELVFLLDEGASYASHIDSILKNLDIPDETDDDDETSKD